MRIRPLLIRAALALGMACALPAGASAAVIYDEIVVKNAAGAILASVSATPAEIAADPHAVFYVSGIAIDPAKIGDYGVVLDHGGNSLEIFGIGNGGPDGYDLSFGGEGAAAGYLIQNAQADTGAPIDLTMYVDPALQLLGDTATFRSVELGSGVPEPLSWAMMVIGFAAVGASMRRAASLKALAPSAR